MNQDATTPSRDREGADSALPASNHRSATATATTTDKTDPGLQAWPLLRVSLLLVGVAMPAVWFALPLLGHADQRDEAVTGAALMLGASVVGLAPVWFTRGWPADKRAVAAGLGSVIVRLAASAAALAGWVMTTPVEQRAGVALWGLGWYVLLWAGELYAVSRRQAVTT